MKPLSLLLSFLPTPAIVPVATLGPVGYVKYGPGTVGSLLGVFFYTAFLLKMGWLGWLLALFLVVLAIAWCGEAEKRLFKHDPSEIILDEFVAQPFAFLALPWVVHLAPIWFWMLLGFVFFRFFDVVKPFGIKRLQKYEGGLGVVIDDLAAAMAAALCLSLTGWLLASQGWSFG